MPRGKYGVPEGRTYRTGPRVTPLTDVSRQTKAEAKAGRSVAAGVVAGAWFGRQVLQTLQTGSGAQVEAANVAGEEAARQWLARSRAFGWCRAHGRRRKG